MATNTPIQSITLTSAASSVTFNNIDQTYTDLTLVINASVVSGSGYTLRFQVGNSTVDSGTNYSWTQFIGDGSSATAGYSGASPQNQYMYGGRVDNSPVFGTTVAYLLGYSNTNVYKSALIKGGVSSVRTGMTSNTWRSTAAINIITVSNEAAVNFAAGSTFHLYGVRSGGTAKAAGGDIVVSDGTYWYHAFLKTGVFTSAVSNLSTEAIVVAGAGGGGGSIYSGGGGGGAGGVRYYSSTLTTTPIAVTVGAGGAGGIASPGFNGTGSTFGFFATSGGGAGAADGYYSLGKPGGSGGGGSGRQGTSGSPGSGQPGGSGNSGGYSPVEGYAGGAGYGDYTSTGSSGGGGGAGGNGGNASNGGSQIGYGGAGGASINTLTGWGSFSAALTALGLGVSGYLAGGGGGGVASTSSGSGGTGGGGGAGNGGLVNNSGGSGRANTGSGAGGSGNYSGNSGGQGGSGIVIVRYAV